MNETLHKHHQGAITQHHVGESCPRCPYLSYVCVRYHKKFQRVVKLWSEDETLQVRHG